jgi:hypothetical protein
MTSWVRAGHLGGTRRARTQMTIPLRMRPGICTAISFRVAPSPEPIARAAGRRANRGPARVTANETVHWTGGCGGISLQQGQELRSRPAGQATHGERPTDGARPGHTAANCRDARPANAPGVTRHRAGPPLIAITAAAPARAANAKPAGAVAPVWRATPPFERVPPARSVAVHPASRAGRTWRHVGSRIPPPGRAHLSQNIAPWMPLALVSRNAAVWF